MSSLISLRTGRELLYQDRRTAFDETLGYSHHDMSGMDECFPTVAACTGLTPQGCRYDYTDHGLLWQTGWQAQERDGRLDMSCELPSLGCTFHRKCSLEAENVVLLEYRIVNTGSNRVPYVYSAHPLLAADEHTRVHLPQEMRRAFNYVAADNFGVLKASWFDLPWKNDADIEGPYSLSRHTSASVEHPNSGDRLVISFDTAALPYLGFLASQGHDTLGDGHFTGEFLLAIEPTTGIGDDLATCARQNTLAALGPGESQAFWIRLAVEEMRRPGERKASALRRSSPVGLLSSKGHERL